MRHTLTPCRPFRDRDAAQHENVNSAPVSSAIYRAQQLNDPRAPRSGLSSLGGDYPLSEMIYIRQLSDPSEEQVEAAVQVLMSAFRNDSGMASLSGGNRHLEGVIYRMSIRASVTRGEFHVAIDNDIIQGVAIWIGPGTDWLFYEQPEFTGQLSPYLKECTGLLMEDLYNAAFRAEFQRQGTGRTLLKAVSHKADSTSKRMIADVKSPHNVQCFRSLGFSYRSVKNFAAKDFVGFPLWCMPHHVLQPLGYPQS
ncbi:hypothetical protein A0H81_03360 [Grifola frondosa]|uniref:N-acetyltransferase domain-containing protein n=1 Tax=Grifola frondosa TaxID=5627 RepID=A0A1C7MJ10_GRIFR|nr:hypothetical protein A0H81_03360 [Grifola frondosa]